MAEKNETKFKKRIRPLLEAIPRSWWLKTQERTMRGVPDFLGSVRGHFVALELKMDGEEPDMLQEWVLGKIIKAGGMAVCVTPKNWPEVYKTLLQISNGTLRFTGSEDFIEDPKFSS